MVQAHGQGRGAAACSSAKMLLPGCRGALWVSAARRGPRRGGGAARSFFGEDQEKQLQQMIQDAERAEQTNTEEEQFGKVWRVAFISLCSFIVILLFKLSTPVIESTIVRSPLYDNSSPKE